MGDPEQGRLASKGSVVRKESNQSQNGKHMITVYDLRVWGEIDYLDSATDYREYLTPPAPQTGAEQDLEFLDDQTGFPWTMLVKFVSLAVAVCILLLLFASTG
jgi:hypothetical protein